MSDQISGDSYDEYPYPSLSYSLSHPDRMATAATLFGLTPTPLERCRVLDIGCAVGGNLFPMAYTLPESEFVGIDYAARQIEIGREHLAELGLTNVQLEKMDILDVPPDFGQFDYIIAHGIYSWVPADVRDRLLAVIRQHLSPNGIAYVSYNVYPGWHMMAMIRDMMQYRTRDLTDPSEQVAKAKALIDLLAKEEYADNKAFGAFLESYHKSLTEKLEQGDDHGDSLLLHDELSEVNDPVYFHEFVNHIRGHGLQYLSEVELFQVSPSRFSKEIIGELSRVAKDPVDIEQYMDFLQNRTFRKSLLCHKEVSVTRRLRPEILNDFYVSSYAKPVAESPDLHGATVEQFKGKDGSTFATDHPLSKVAMVYLSENAPKIMRFEELVALGAQELGIGKDKELAKETRVLAANMLRAYSYNESLVQLHVYAPPFVTQASEKPLASPIARWQAKKFSRVTSLRHERVALDRISRLILAYLDGNHDRQAILDIIVEFHKDGQIVLTDEEEKNIDPKALRELMAKDIDHNFNFFAWAALLIG